MCGFAVEASARGPMRCTRRAGRGRRRWRYAPRRQVQGTHLRFGVESRGALGRKISVLDGERCAQPCALARRLRQRRLCRCRLRPLRITHLRRRCDASVRRCTSAAASCARRCVGSRCVGPRAPARLAGAAAPRCAAEPHAARSAWGAASPRKKWATPLAEAARRQRAHLLLLCELLQHAIQRRGSARHSGRRGARRRDGARVHGCRSAALFVPTARSPPAPRRHLFRQADWDTHERHMTRRLRAQDQHQ